VGIGAYSGPGVAHLSIETAVRPNVAGSVRRDERVSRRHFDT